MELSRSEAGAGTFGSQEDEQSESRRRGAPVQAPAAAVGEGRCRRCTPGDWRDVPISPHCLAAHPNKAAPLTLRRRALAALPQPADNQPGAPSTQVRAEGV